MSLCEQAGIRRGTDDCPRCPETLAAVLAEETKTAERWVRAACLCGTVYERREGVVRTVAPPIERRRSDDPLARDGDDVRRPVTTDAAHLAAVLREVEDAARWVGTCRRLRAGGPAEPRCPIGAWQGLSSGAEADATDRQMAALARLVSTPHTRVGRRARAAFVEALLRYCEETGGAPLDAAAIDWTAARTAALRLRAMDGAAGAVLRALQRSCSVRSSWQDACSVAADAVAPAALRTRWTLRYRAPGDRMQPSPAAERLAYGEGVLRGALGAWRAER